MVPESGKREKGECCFCGTGQPPEKTMRQSPFEPRFHLFPPTKTGAVPTAVLCWIVLILAVEGMLPSFAAAAEGSGGGHGVIANIAMCMIGASAMGLLMRLLRQPVILGHILAGVLIGPVGFGLISGHADIVTVSEIGLILLLFMIGLEIDLRTMFSSGRLVILPGILQFPLSLGFGYGVFTLLEGLGVALAQGGFVKLYFSVAIAISSTMIVVKLLYDKFELDTLAGRITVGILVFQDVWAIIVLAVQPNLAHPDIPGIVRTFATGAVLVAASFGVSKYFLPRMFRSVAKIPELVVVLSLGWCFLVALVAHHPRVGLSMEMGALIAGVSLATFPYNLEVVARVVSIRDFFITLFFVALGMQIPWPNVDMIIMAVALAAVAVFVRFLSVFGILYPLRAGHRVSLLSTINLSQISEFSLVILTLGIGYGHIPKETVTPVIWVFAILAVASTYAIQYSHPLQGAVSRLLTRAGLKDVGGGEEEPEGEAARPVVVLGFFRNASAFLDEAARKAPHLMKKVEVIDFNPLVRERLERIGIPCVYGDISHLDTLHHAGIQHARVVLCSIPDSILKGTSNLRLLRVLKGMCPKAAVILTAEGTQQARELLAAGADYVIQSAALAGRDALQAVERCLDGKLGVLREEAVTDLAGRHEILD